METDDKTRDRATIPSRYLYGTTIAEEAPADGISGVLCRDAKGGYFFRVYRQSGEFTDYDLRHDDLAITIASQALASFYTFGDDHILDHSPQVLGLRKAESG